MSNISAPSADAVTIHGTVAPGFEPVREVFAENFRDRNELGAAVAVYSRGEPVVDLWGGYRDTDREVDLLADLDERVRSRVSVGYRVQSDRYTVDTVTEILDRRATQGLEPGAVQRETLRQIAEFAEGDAPRAITSLRVAARKAGEDGLSTIPSRIVEESVLDAEEEVRQKAISKLNDHQRVLYECIQADGPLIQKDLYDRYCEQHPDPITLRRLRKTHLPKLLHYNLIQVGRDADSQPIPTNEVATFGD